MRIAFLGLALLAMGHHSHPAFYDQCKSLTIEGKVDTVQWKNPHVLIDLTTADGSAYRAEWTSAGALERLAVQPPKAGDNLLVTGNPMRDVASIRARFPDLKLEAPEKPVVDVAQIRRASDGFSWSRNPGPTPQNCR